MGWESEGGDLVYTFHPVSGGEWDWVLVRERLDGSFYMADTVPVEGESKYPGSPF